MIIFGCIQLLFTQIPNMEEIWWVSIVAAIMSFVYSIIGLGLSIGKATGEWSCRPDSLPAVACSRAQAAAPVLACEQHAAYLHGSRMKLAWDAGRYCCSNGM